MSEPKNIKLIMKDLGSPNLWLNLIKSEDKHLDWSSPEGFAAGVGRSTDLAHKLNPPMSANPANGFGEAQHKTLISHAFDASRQLGYPHDINTYKKQLMNARQAGHVNLARLDMPQAATNPSAVAASETRMNSSDPYIHSSHFIDQTHATPILPKKNDIIGQRSQGSVNTHAPLPTRSPVSSTQSATPRVSSAVKPSGTPFVTARVDLHSGEELNEHGLTRAQHAKTQQPARPKIPPPIKTSIAPTSGNTGTKTTSSDGVGKSLYLNTTQSFLVLKVKK